MNNKSAPTQKQRRAQYTPHWQQTNALAARVCGIKPSGEIEWIEAENNRKAERKALLEQINRLEKTEQL